MKNYVSIIAICLLSTFSYGQNFKELANSEFKDEASYKESEKNVLSAANYLFDTPTDKADLNRLNALQYIIKWMTGTPDYTFDLGGEAMELTKGNDDLLGMYMAAMTKTVLENPDENLSNDEIYKRSETLLIDYCEDETNHIKPSKKIKKMLKAKD